MRLAKVLVLISSFSLMALFVIYRGGYFDIFFIKKDVPILSSSNGGAMSGRDTASSSKAISKMTMSSSKSLVITEGMPLANDSTLRKIEDSFKAAKMRKETIMYSSKSGAIFTPKKFFPDSLFPNQKKDSL